MRTYTDRRPLFLWMRQPPSEAYVVLNNKEAEQFKNRVGDMWGKVQVRANQIFGRDATPQIVKVCDEQGTELRVIHRTPPRAANDPEPS